LPDSGSIQNISFGIGRAIIPGVRLGIYASYLNLGGFNDINQLGSFIRTVDSADFIIGVPIVFDPSSLPFKRVNGEPSAAEKVLRQFSTGVNLNVYQSTFDKTQTAAFLMDFNLSTRLKLSYIGQPRSLITPEELDKERDSIKKKLAEELGFREGKKSISNNQVAEKQKELFFRFYDDVYDDRKSDLQTVANTRRDIYKIYNDATVELSPAETSNYYQIAITELMQMEREARSTIAEGEREISKAIDSDISNVDAAYQEGLQHIAELKSSDLFQKKVTDLSTLVANFLNEAYDVKQTTTIKGFFLPVYKSAPKGATNSGAKSHVTFMEYVAVPGDTWDIVAEKKLLSKKKKNELLAYNKKRPTDVLLPGQIVRIPLVQAVESQKNRRKSFDKAFSESVNDLNRMKLRAEENLALEDLVTRIKQTIDLYYFKEQQISERDDSLLQVGNLLSDQKSLLESNREDILKNLNKIRLKKQLDLLNAASLPAPGNERAIKIGMNDYKIKERKIFETMLLGIFHAKNIFVKEFQKQAESLKENRLASLKRMSIFENDVAISVRKTMLLAAGKDKDKIKKAEDVYKAAIAKNQEEDNKKLRQIETDAKAKNNELAWRKYLSEMIYRGSSEKVDTLAFGVSVKNVGTQLNYGKSTEAAPLSISGDINYAILKLENHDLSLMGHYGYSVYEDSQFSFALAYRLFNRFEVRSGLLFENAGMVPSVGLSALVELGLMNYRLDVGAQLRENYGAVFNIGLSIVF
jgi:hypothetical protein